MMRQLLDVMHQAVELPLRIDLALSPESEPVQLLCAGYDRTPVPPWQSVARISFVLPELSIRAFILSVKDSVPSVLP